MSGPSHEPPLAQLHTDVTALRTQVQDLRGQLEASSPAAKAGIITKWNDAQDRIRQRLGQIEPPDLFAGIDPHVPLALLPVRLETRFGDPGTNVLHVRIFPDDAHVDGHDPQLTENEAALGAALWSAPADLLADGEQAPADPPATDAADGRRARWAALVRLLGGSRAAWVAHATRPGAPAPATKTQAYSRPAVARALPDRFLVRAYVGDAAVGEAWTLPIAAALNLAPDPQAVPAGDDGGDGLPPLDPGMRWMLDYPTALAAGMAVDITLPADTNAIDRVIAVGVRASTAPADSAGELAALMTAHRYTDGLGFLAAGSPTANTPDARSADDRRADPDLVWQAEFGAPAGADSAAAGLAGALGVEPATLASSPGSHDAGDGRARAMQTAIWAATWGYYLGELVDASALADTNVDAVRDHYLRFVRGRGTLPTIRLGSQPYGVLPLVPLDRWTADGASTTVDGLAGLLGRIRPLWQYGVGLPVTAAEGPGFEDAFSKAMSTDAVARSFTIRTAIADRSFDPAVFTGIDVKSGTAVIDSMLGSLLGVGHNPFMLEVFSPTAQPVRAPLVVDPRDPTPDATVQAAIQQLTATNPLLVLTLPVFLKPQPSGPPTLLHTLLRRSLLLEYAAAGLSLTRPLEIEPAAAAAAAAAPSAPALETKLAAAPASMLSGLSPDPKGGFTPVSTLPTVLSSPAPAVTGSLSAAEWLWRNPSQLIDRRRDLDQTLEALGVLGALGAEELELLLCETLDLATHRYTAWAESVAADKLARLRSATPAGVTIGGFGIVERLSRRPRTSVDPELSAGLSKGPLWEDVRPGGFVHAPSTAQAATASVLRAGHLAHGGDSDAAFAVDLSSGPTREALRLADGIRGGQELGALLGYELERDLHERSADVLIAPLRAYAPRWKASGTFVEGDAEEVVSPSAVVDGLALAGDDPDAVTAAVVPAGSPAALTTSLQEALATLRQHQHALADLFTAESIHQVLSGNAARAGAVLDAAARGGRPPDAFDVVRTPRSGAGLTSRLAVILPDAKQPLVGGWPQSPRGEADAACAGWLARVLPAPAEIHIRVADPGGAVTDATLPASAGVGPLDLVVDHPDVVRTRIRLALPPGSTLVPERDPSWPASTVSLEEVLTVGADLRELVASRALRRADLLTPGAGSGGADERDAAELETRLTDARTSTQAAADAVTAALGPLQDAVAGTSTTGLAPALAAARTAVGGALAHGVVLQLPDVDAAPDVLAALTSAAAELTRRLAEPAPAAGASVDELTAGLETLLGPAQPAVPRIELAADASALAAGLAAGDGYLGGDPELAGDWLADVAAVRPAAGRFAAAFAGCEALTGGAGLDDTLRIVEPSGAGTAWTATLGSAELGAMAPAATVVAWASPGDTFAAGTPVAGLLVDDWTEVVPQPVAATSIAYQAEAPSARAPQAILLGIAPNVAAGWDVETVVDLVREAATLASLRLVDAETGAWFGRMLPAVLLPDGDATDVIAAPAFPLLQVDAVVLEAARAKTKALG
jgi:hypothetical protein